jgi:AcrR family transcriptional regulator
MFTRLGYDGAGMREIAREAGADARLIGRYFGSKELLFAEVIDVVYQKTLMMTLGVNHDAASALLADRKPADLDGLLLTIRSASNDRAVAIMRDSIEGNYQRELAEALDGEEADGRAALLVAICTGVQFSRNVMGNTSLAGGNLPVLTEYLEAALDAIAVARPRPAEITAGQEVGSATGGAASGGTADRVAATGVAAGGRDLRSAVVEATARLLAREGPSGLAVRRIAAEAGCSTMVVYHYFEGKRGLLDAVYVEGFERLIAAQHIDWTDDAEADVLRMCRVYRTVALADPDYHEVMFGRPVPDFAPSPESRGYARRSYEQFVDAVRRWQVGTALAAPVPAAAHLLLATGHGLVALELNGNAPTDDPEAAYEAAVRLTLRGLRL